MQASELRRRQGLGDSAKTLLLAGGAVVMAIVAASILMVSFRASERLSPPAQAPTVTNTVDANSADNGYIGRKDRIEMAAGQPAAANDGADSSASVQSAGFGLLP